MKRLMILWVLVMLLASTLFAEKVSLSSGENTLQVLSSDAYESILEYKISNFDQKAVSINGTQWHQINLPKEGVLQEKGMPALPVFNRSIAIAGDAKMALEVYDIQYTDIRLPIAPSKGVIARNVDPSSIPYEFDLFYQGDKFFPHNVAELSDPYILRDVRGITIKTVPFAYKPDTQTLRVYTNYKIKVYRQGTDSVNTLATQRDAFSRDFLPIYENQFINWQFNRYTPVSDSYGKLLVICHTNYMSTILPYVNWKKQKGIVTELVEWSTIGTTAAQLQTYIQNRYNADNTITYVQLVGDAPQIPSLSSGGGGSDPTFALVAGSDNYPDIFIGRFSAETTAQVTAQINKAIVYERDATISDTWLSRAMGIASAEGGGTQGDNGESDIQHMNNIRTDLLGFGYTTVDQVYDPGALASTVTTNVNAGRGFINYVGHGSDTSWVTTGFSNTNATALTNGTKTPVIMDVACVNGNFVSMTCFAEAWLRNANGGAVTMYASTINQSWNSPMLAQDEFTDLMVAGSKSTAGGLYYNSSCKMMDTYGNTTGSDGVNMYKTWHIFGDASLLVRSKTPIAMTVTHPAQFIIGGTSISVSTGVANALVALTYNNTIYGKGLTNSSGNLTLTISGAPATAVTYTLTVTAVNRVTYVGTVQQVPGTGPYMSVTSANYADSNNNVAEYNENGTYNVVFQNIGSAAASSVTATLSTVTAGITITDATETIASLASGASVTKNGAFGISIANNIVNGTSAAFTITMVSGADSWTYSFSQTIAAPALAFGSMQISDPTGNNNGRLDPGETVTITIPLDNTGAAASLAGSASLSSPTNGISIINGSFSFSSIAVSGSANLSFTASAASSMTVGTVASFAFSASAGTYTAAKTETSAVGLIIEDFESGTFNSYPWVLSGNLNWSVVNSGAYAGTYAAKSGAITHSQSSVIQTTRILNSAGSVSFWYKVSSESGYDYLKFYVDGVLQNTPGWAGEIGWTQASYNLSAGTRVLKWEYMKDSSVSSGSDCAWIDNIVFPASTSPNSFFPPQNLSASVGNQRVNLSWQAPASGTPTGYKIFKNSNLLTTVTALTYSDTAVTNGTTYTYYLKAVYSGGESDATDPVTAIPNIVTEVIIGTGTTATGTQEGAPVNVWYKSLHGQSVYTAAELTAAGVTAGTSITGLGFNIVSLPDQVMPNYVVRMKHTTSANVASWIDAANLTTVYSNASYAPTATGWNMYTFSTPFVWNGTDNILVDTAFGLVANYTSTGTVQYTSTTNGYRYVRLDTADQTNVFTGGSATVYRPNIKLALQPQATNQAIIAVTPTSINQTVIEGNSVETAITIRNNGDIALEWSIDGREVRTSVNETRPAWHSVDITSGTIAAGGNTVITLTMDSSALSVATHTSSLVFRSNATNNPALNVPISFTVSPSPYPNQPRFVAEWEPGKGAIVVYPWGQPYSLLRDLAANDLLYVVVTSANQSTANSNLVSNSVNMTNVRYINATTDSYWVRDYGPWTIFDANNSMKIVDFTYNRPRPNDDVIPTTIANYLGKGTYNMNVSHTGGNIMTDGMGKAMSTELVLEENTSLSQSQINQAFNSYLGVTDYQIYTDPNNTYIDHIDCWAKLLDVDKVLIRSVPTTHAQYSAIQATVAQWQNAVSSYGTPYRIFRVNTPNNEPYTNSYILNKKIYVPQMGTANDAAALQVYRTAMPGYTVTGYTHTSYESTDALHCRVNTVFDDQMISLRHTPISNLQAWQSSTISVTVSHSNAIDTANSFVSYSYSATGPWQQSALTNLSGNIWQASVTNPQYGANLYYWIQVKDTTGRTTTLPLCAGSDPFVAAVNVPVTVVPGWEVVSYPNPPATIHGIVSVLGFAAEVGDLVSAWVDEECRGTAVVTATRNAYVSIQVQLNEPNETISFRVFSQGENEVYYSTDTVSPAFGEVIGAGSPIPIVTETITSLAKPSVSIVKNGTVMKLMWNNVLYANRYDVFYCDTLDGDYTLMQSVRGNECVLDGNHTRMFYKVKAMRETPVRSKN